MSLHPGKPGGSGVTLLPAIPDDAREIGAIAGEIWPTAYRGIISESQIEFMLRWMYSPSKLNEEMTREGVIYFWIVSNDSKTGFIAVGPSPDEMTSYQLHKFYLLTDIQGKGVGGRAMELLIQWLSRLSAKRLELRVNRQNTRAIAFYHRHGFQIYAGDCREIGGGFVMDDFLMCRLIPEESKPPENG